MSSVNSIIHCNYFNETLREWQCQNSVIKSANLMYPIFILDEDMKEEIKSMPGVYRQGINHLRNLLDPLVKLGLKSVLLFGVINKLPKDSYGFHADSVQNPVIVALPLLKQWYPDLTIACDVRKYVCLCAYTSHGHCGIIENQLIDNTKSIKRLGEIALAYALAGAHIVAPSCMMDGHVKSIKQHLMEGGLISRVAVLSYSAKFCSTFYGPFRDAANCAPSFSNRASYQLPVGSYNLAERVVDRDVSECCDMIMVKPGMMYLDIIKNVKNKYPHIPLFIYQVSGEYSMIYHAAQAGVFTLRNGLIEILQSMRRADVIVSYYTPEILKWLKEGEL
ncbi:delta-aminolevulinic acid dehydratase isoform X2 [Daktulosphaira vitifoliae]|uniref:delta-aminolevulinic acid dehydratase isoform X2 n=1 Tax=Daktulosphaira vitifoliae TaxID=58002 RepID=UPI0021A9BF5D|nr:delta-aminolevulinic acid dehydratase isoform X2 [Daktulosphaira vitifoliae]